MTIRTVEVPDPAQQTEAERIQFELSQVERNIAELQKRSNVLRERLRLIPQSA
jgi:hypothetical protein